MSAVYFINCSQFLNLFPGNKIFLNGSSCLFLEEVLQFNCPLEDHFWTINWLIWKRNGSIAIKGIGLARKRIYYCLLYYVTALLPVRPVGSVSMFQVLPTRPDMQHTPIHTSTVTHTLIVLLNTKKYLEEHLISTPTEAYDIPMMLVVFPVWTKKRNSHTHKYTHTHTHMQPTKLPHPVSKYSGYCLMILLAWCREMKRKQIRSSKRRQGENTEGSTEESLCNSRYTPHIKNNHASWSAE